MSLDSFSFFALAVATEDGGDGFLLLQIIGVICGILGLIFFLVLLWEWFAFLIFIPVCMQREKETLSQPCLCLVVSVL